MKKLVFIYPYLTSYIVPVIKGLVESQKICIDMLYGYLPQGMGFNEDEHFKNPNIRWIKVKEYKPFGNHFGMFQKGVITHIIKTHPDIILIWANPRYLSFWAVMLIGKLMKIPVYPRGHGLFKKKHIGILQILEYKTILSLSSKYICYTPKVKQSLDSFGKYTNKLVVDFNTIYNECPVIPLEKKGNEKGIFYIGRIRENCGIQVLIEAISQINSNNKKNIELFIIGDGQSGEYIKEIATQQQWIHYYGRVFDNKQINEISRECRFGCVPGFMGLNVVHMMSLSLPVITHRELKKHMGPEPEYIQHNKNGWLIDKPNDVFLLTNLLKSVWEITTKDMLEIQFNAFMTYKLLSDPPLHERLLQILEI